MTAGLPSSGGSGFSRDHSAVSSRLKPLLLWPALAQRANAHAPLDIAALAAFRILFGTLMFIGTLRFMALGWVQRQYVEPSFHFKYWGFSWVQVPGETGLYLLYGGIALSAFLVAIGAFYRLAIISFWCLFTYAELMDVTWYLNHYYFVSLLALILCFLSPHRAWSVDAWRRPALRAATLPAWQTGWLRFQVGLLYFYAGWAKFEADWLLHAQPLNLWLPPHAGLPLLGPLLDEVWVHFAFSWFAFLFDVTIIGFMLWRRSRLLAFGVILVFHLMTHLFFNIGLFPLIMVLAVLVFFEPDWPRRVLRALGIAAEAAATSKTCRRSGFSRDQTLRPLFASLILTFCAVQFLLPLRHWLYPGSVTWHEQGMRFSWRVMLRQKSGALSYRVVDAQGNSRLVSPREYLTEAQYREMVGQPDLILQLAHHIRDKMAAGGQAPAAIYADAQVSLNGRRAALLIRPEVNLAAVHDGLGRASWIAAPPAGPPPMHRPLQIWARR